jgi:hypothetical protein
MPDETSAAEPPSEADLDRIEQMIESQPTITWCA